MNLRELFHAFVQALESSGTPKELDALNSLIAGSTRTIDLQHMPEQIRTDVSQLLLMLTDPQYAELLIGGLSSAKLADRIAATDKVHMMVLAIAAKGSGPIDKQIVQKLIDDFGVNALLLIPGMTLAYRRHLSAGGTAANFADFILSKRNRGLALALRHVLGDARLHKVFGIDPTRVFTVGIVGFQASPEAHRAVMNGLRDAAGILGEKIFLRILLSKTTKRSKAEMDALEKALVDAIGKRALPSLSDADYGKAFRVADRAALQGPIGELLALLRLVETARKLIPKSTTGKVYILLETKVDATRTLVPRQLRSLFEKRPTASALDTEAERALEEAADAATSKFKSQEFTDGLIVEFDSKGRMWMLAKQESKVVDQTATLDALIQLDKTREDVDAIHKLSVGTLIEVTATGTREVPLEEAAKLSGGRVVTEVRKGTMVRQSLEIAEKEEVVKALEQLEKGPASAAEHKLRAERKLQNLKGGEKMILVGSGQLERLQQLEGSGVKLIEGIPRYEDAAVISYGHEFEALRDVAVQMLATLPFRSL